jgi:hypothetical protein
MLPGMPPTVIWHGGGGLGGGVGTWWATQDGGEHRSFLAPPSPYPMRSDRLVLSTLGRDGTLFFNATGGIWALGPSAARTASRLPCPITEDALFTAARAAAMQAQPFVGCPAEAPRAVTIRERRLGDTRAVWLDDDSSNWLELHDGLNTSIYTRVRLHPKLDEPWSGPPDRVVDGEAAQYDGGLIVRLPRADGSRVVLVIGQYAWEEVAEP